VAVLGDVAILAMRGRETTMWLRFTVALATAFALAGCTIDRTVRELDRPRQIRLEDLESGATTSGATGEPRGEPAPGGGESWDGDSTGSWF